MIKQTLHSNRLNQVDNVIHIADVHIRNFKRHDEYESVFNRLYDYCRQDVSKNKNTIIYLAGDIVHAKTDMSPELIVQTRNFFVNLAEIAPVILIAGNHDMNLNNRNRLDSLSPIVDSVDTPDFFYLKETGIYTLGGVHFILNAVWEDPENFIKSSDIVEDGIKVVLYHGAIDRADIGTGYQIKNNRVTVEMFRGFDFGMFGDIHAFQYLDGDGKFAYAGSLIQQNFGEGLVHGIMKWELKERRSKFIPIQNDWAYYTIDIDNGNFVNLPSEFSPYNRIRVRSYNTSNSDLFKSITKLRSIIKVDDVRVQKFSTKSTGNANVTPITLENVRDVEHQNKLISVYLKKTFGVSDDVIDQVCKINENINKQISKTPVLRNVVWTPILFEFENMFSYGENNTINFTQMNGTYGIFAANASGKSSILDALSFCIFDKCSRTFKASQVLNNKKDGFRCKFQFQINGQDYWIERVATKDKKGHVKVNVDFWYEENGEVVSLNGDDRDGTNFVIRNYLGTYDDFIITALSLQGNNTNFIDKAQRERKDLLAQFLDLDLFEELNGIASDEIKSVQALIKEFSRQDYSEKIAEANEDRKKFSLQLKELNEEKDRRQKKIDLHNQEIMALVKVLKHIDSGLMTHNLEVLIEKRKDIDRKIDLSEREFVELNAELTSKNRLLVGEQEQFNSMNYEELVQQKKDRNNLEVRYGAVFAKLGKIELQISHNQSKIDNLSNHQYDPNCQYCVNNVFVKDAKDAEAAIVELKEQHNELFSELEKIKMDLSQIPNPEIHLKLHAELERKIINEQKSINEVQNRLTQNKSNYTDLENNKAKIEEIIRKFVDNEEIIKENKNIQSSIAKIEFERDSFRAGLKVIDQDIISISGQLRVCEKTLQDCAESVRKLKELEIRFKAYDLYLKAVNRNGVPYSLISDALPKVQAEVNSILSQIVDFEILFETDGKSINTYIVYDNENFWPLEMTSGMEKFISSLAIRTALINVSSLPRPNFIAIDEGWGTLDSENLNSLNMLFDYIKTQFDFMLTISHIDALRDIVDKVIEINKENGFSNIRF